MHDISRLFATIRTNTYIRHFYISIVRFRQQINASAQRLVAYFFALRRYHKMPSHLGGMKGARRAFMGPPNLFDIFAQTARLANALPRIGIKKAPSPFKNWERCEFPASSDGSAYFMR